VNAIARELIVKMCQNDFHPDALTVAIVREAAERIIQRRDTILIDSLLERLKEPRPALSNRCFAAKAMTLTSRPMINSLCDLGLIRVMNRA